jgi:hypothetical protein
VPSGSLTVARTRWRCQPGSLVGSASNAVYTGEDESVPIAGPTPGTDAALERHDVAGLLGVDGGADLDGDRAPGCPRMGPRWSPAGLEPPSPGWPLAAVWPRLSITTARYCTAVPDFSALVSWKTWYGALSSVPIGCQLAGTDLGVEGDLVEGVTGHARLDVACGTGSLRMGQVAQA